ncbi:MAG: D-alanine--D-alanine ligase [Coriobacteriales bacterium]|nr:D-alanine--D-alanine ligase [Coriobacteriales bacterium]
MPALQHSEIRVAVLAGGTSNEREISLSSGDGVYKALKERGYYTIFIDTKDVVNMINQLVSQNITIAFVALHGKGGEDGTIQGILELLHIPYTGSGVLASALGMDKARAKICFKEHGIPIAPSLHLYKGQQISLENILTVIGEKCVVKPNKDGSSVGITIIHNAQELEDFLPSLFDVSDDMLIEKYVAGTEVTAVVLGNDNPNALPVIEIVPHAEYYDYHVKYSADGADHIIPARLDEAVYKQVQEYAVRAHKALGCRGMSRSDFIITPQGECVILETNTIPGMTPTSLLPDAAKHVGYDFGDVCEKILELALES